jgi:hypothetical protein
MFHLPVFSLPTAVKDSVSSLQNMGVASVQEAYFVFAIGLLCLLNSGFVNDLCFSGLITEDGSMQQAVSHVSKTYTRSTLLLANGGVGLFRFNTCLILCFIGGTTLVGVMNPKAVPHKLVP